MAVTLTEDTSANWTSNNTVLSAGVIGQESNTGMLKIGDGGTTWRNLAYFPADGRIDELVGLSPTAAAVLAQKGGPLALTGATAPARFVGGTASGAPISGTFAVGDFIVDANGMFWVCTTAGTPGTWTRNGPTQLTTGLATTVTAGGTTENPTVSVNSLVAPPVPLLPSGSYAFPISTNNTSTSATTGNGNFRCAPCFLPAMSITRIGGEITAAGTAGCTYRLGIYADAGMTPGALVLDAGTIAGDSATVQEITLGSTLVLTAGWYWLGGVLQGTPASQPTVRTIASPPTPGFLLTQTTTIPGSGATSVGVLAGGVTGALPGTFGTAGVTGSAPRLFFKLA